MEPETPMPSLSARVENGVRLLLLDGRERVADAASLAAVRSRTPHLQPVPLGMAPSFGFGDRTGLATPGHVAALRRAGVGIAPIFAQQSIREMARTSRTPQQVMDDATFGLLQSDLTQSAWASPVGADADHLKTPEDIDVTAAAGFTFFTLDPSAAVDAAADRLSLEELRSRADALAAEMPWLTEYVGQAWTLDTGRRVEFTEAACLRAGVKYGQAIALAIGLAQHVDRAMAGRPYEIELSVDETVHPTSLVEHALIAERCRAGGMRLVSLAPRFIGEFEKGVDYKGDLSALDRSIADHAELARRLGPYKLSLHSGSDKLSIYPILARHTNGRFHVKTAGTSYLEALRVAALQHPALFRRIVAFARERYEADKATYHVSARLDAVPPPEAVSDPVALEQLYLERWSEVPVGRGFTAPGRQILHCTFGSVMGDADLGGGLRQVLIDHADTYAEVLEDHFARHLFALRA